MNKEIVITEKTTVKELTNTLALIFPGFVLTIKNKDYQTANENTLLKNLFRFKRELPFEIAVGTEFDDTFKSILTKTGLNMSYINLIKYELAEYHLSGETKIKEIIKIFNNHFPLFIVSFAFNNKSLKPETKLKDISINYYKLIIYDQYSSTVRYFSYDTGIEILSS